MSLPVQELPTEYKLVHAYRLPLRGRLGHVPALQVGYGSVTVMLLWSALTVTWQRATPFSSKT